MDAVAHPLGEVGVTDLPLLFGVLVFYQLFQVIVVQIFLLSEVSQDVLHSDVSIVV